VEILTHTYMKTQTKHTPGPWTVVGTHVERHDGDGIYSRLAACHDTMICEEHGGTALANARLIAAAPDLLVALEQCVSIIVRHANATLGDGVVTLQVARAAIAKAQGE
jgi:hypothetical protein